MLALALCVTAIAYYVSPTIRRCCHRKDRRPIPTEVINEYGDL